MAIMNRIAGGYFTPSQSARSSSRPGTNAPITTKKPARDQSSEYLPRSSRRRTSRRMKPEAQHADDDDEDLRAAHAPRASRVESRVASGCLADVEEHDHERERSSRRAGSAGWRARRRSGRAC